MATSAVGNYELNYAPDWTAQTGASNVYAQSIPGALTDTYNNWYGSQPGQDLSAEVSQPYQNTIYGGLAGATNYNQNMNAATDLTQQNTGYNAANNQQFMNPYVQNVVDANTRMSNQNLFENILPGVNSTFAGAGQFGSSRNADFTNRAIRDQQQTLANTNATALHNAQNQANANQLSWANQGLAGANQLGNLANTQQANAMNAGNAQQTLNQAALDKNYSNWVAQQQYPLSGLTALGQYTGAAAAGNQPNMYTPTSPTDDATRLSAILNAAGQGLSDTTIQSWIDRLFGAGN